MKKLLEEKFIERMEKKFGMRKEVPLRSAVAELTYIRLNKNDVMEIISTSKKIKVNGNKHKVLSWNE